MNATTNRQGIALSIPAHIQRQALSENAREKHGIHLVFRPVRFAAYRPRTDTEEGYMVAPDAAAAERMLAKVTEDGEQVMYG